MRKMSVLELLFALLLVCLLAVMAGVAYLVWNLVRRADGQSRDVAELKLRLEAGGQAQGTQAAELRERLSQTQSVGFCAPSSSRIRTSASNTGVRICSSVVATSGL